MIKISDVIRDILAEHPFFEMGMSERLFNLTQLAKFIQPMVEARAQKPVQTSAILVNLSRMQLNKEKQRRQSKNCEMENITMQVSLAMVTFYKNEKVTQTIAKMDKFFASRQAHFVIMESLNEVGIVFEQRLLETIEPEFPEEPKSLRTDVSALVIKLPKETAHTPGTLHIILQSLAFQSINIWGSLSTFSEFTIYLDQNDLNLAFETLQKGLGKK